MIYPVSCKGNLFMEEAFYYQSNPVRYQVTHTHIRTRYISISFDIHPGVSSRLGLSLLTLKVTLWVSPTSGAFSSVWCIA